MLFRFVFSTLSKSRLVRLLLQLGHFIVPMYGKVKPRLDAFCSIMGALNTCSQSGHLSCLPRLNIAPITIITAMISNGKNMII
jgi:hypothetical protein